MADNESTVSMDAEISLSTNKAVSELTKLSRLLFDVGDNIVKNVSHLDTMIDRLIKVGQVGGKSVAEMSKIEIKEASGLLAKAEQIKRLQEQSNRSMPKQSSVKKHRGQRKRKGGSQAQKSSDDMQQRLESMLDSGIVAEDAKQYASLIRAFTENQKTSHQEILNALEYFKQENASMRNQIKARQQELEAYKNETRRQEIADRREKNQNQAGLNDSKKNLNEAKALNLESLAEVNKAKKTMYDAKAGRINDDYRYNAGWRGGIASGIGGAVSRARARSGFAGFAARVGTGVGQLNPERNILKGATVSGLGINPMTLAFSAVGAGIAKLTEGLGKLAVESLQAYGELDKLKTGLSVVFGSDTEANTVFEGIKEYSLQSPFGVEQTTELATLLKQSGVYGTELLDTMKMLGDTAGGNEEKFKRIANNYAQIASVGKASMLDMRQFAYAGIPIYKKVAEELGVSQSVLRQMISDGEVTNEVMEKVFKTMTSEGGEFYQAVERGAETLNARLTNLKDSINIAKGSWGEVLFKADFRAGGNLDNQGVLGKLLTFVEKIASDIGDIAEKANLDRDVENVSAQDIAVQELGLLIDESNISGIDASILQEIQRAVGGDDFMETQRDVFTRLGDYWRDVADNASFDSLSKLEDEIARLNQILANTPNLSQETKQAIENAISQKNSEVLKYVTYSEASLRHYGIEDATAIDKEMLSAPWIAETDWAKMNKNLEVAKPYVDQTRSLELATKLFEQGQKRASSSTSLTTIAEQSRQEYYNSEQGKAELLEKERKEYEKNYQKFQELRGIIDNTGNILDNVDIDIGKFLDLMKSGIIEPLEGVNTTWSGLAYNKNDSYTKGQEKLGKWEGMALRADDLEKLTKELPDNLRLSFEQIFAILEDSDLNSQGNVSRLDSVLTELKANESFNKNEEAMLMLEYLLTGTASVMDKMYTWEEIKGKGAESVPPLWKRITGSALGVDAAKITNAKDFYDTYTTQFQGRNISKGVISGMVDSGKSIADITKLLRYTGGKGTIGGVTQNTDTMQIDWVKTAEAMAQFALSTEVTIGELESYGNAIEEQIGAYNELKKTMFTTGEDWDKLDASELAKQFENAFSGIGASMVATNALGMTRQVGLNESGEAIFLDTKELVDAQTEYQLSLENTATAVDEAIDRLRESAVEADRVLLLRQTAKGFQDDTMTSHVDSASAMAYRMGYVSSPDALSATLKSTVASLLAMEEADLTAATKTTSAIARQNQENYNNGFVPENWTDSRIIKSYTGLDNLTSESQDMFDTLARAVDMARETIRERSGIPDTGLDQQLIDAEQFLEALESFSYSKMARSAQGNNPQALADWGVIYAQAEKNNSVESYVASVQAELNAKGSQAWASELSGVDIYNQRKSYVARNVRNRLGMDDSKKMQGASLRLYEMFLKLADELGVVDVSLEEFARSLQDDYELRKIEAKQGGDLGGYGSALTENALAMYKLEQAQGDKSGQALQLGRYAGGQALGMVSSSIADTDVGAFAQGTMAGGPWVGLANMLLNAIAKVVGGFEVLDYALNPVTNLLQGIAPYLKLIHLPLVVISRGLEMLGEIFAGWLTGFYDSIFGEGTMEGIDRFYESLGDASGQMDEAAQRLEALNQILEQTRKSIMEAEEYFLVQNRTANAQWAAQMQGQFVMDTRATKVNDMILTPHGNFSTAPDDYLLAMKDPTSLMGTGGNTQVSIKFTVNNNASDVVETTTEEQVGTDGQKELIVTISRMVASDYASGRNGWDSAYSGRESRMKGRRVSR